MFFIVIVVVGRQIYLPGDDEIEEDELLELEKEKLEREIEILDMQKIYLGLKIEREQKIFNEETGPQPVGVQQVQVQGAVNENFGPQETVQFVQVASAE